MYSKKINQLATNLNPQGDDLILIGDAETGQLKTTSFNNISDVSSDGVISGGIVTWTGIGLIFDISECVYILNGVRYTSPFTTKTLTAADPTNPRIDVFAVNTSSQVEVIQGTPATNPVEPEGDTQTTLGLTNVTINAGATTPNGVTRDLIYDENVESWTKSVVQSLSTYSYTNTTYAYTGTKSILATHGGGNSGFLFFLFNKGSQLNVSDFTSISFAIRLNAAMSNGTSLGIQFYDSTTLVSNTYIINSNNSVGFNRTLAGVWQFITIPLNGTIIKFTSNKFTTFRIGTSGTAITYNLDTISLNGGINNPGGTTSANSFGFVNGSTGSAASTIATDTLNVVGSGLITTSATGKTLTIASNQIATGSILGRVTAGTGNIETLTGTQATTLLDTFTSSLKGLAPASGGGTTNFLRADGTWAAAGGGTTIYTGDGTLTADRTVTNSTYLLKFVGGKEIIATEETALRLETSTTGKAALILSLNNTFTTTGKNWLIRSLSTGALDIRNITNPLTVLNFSSTGQATFIGNISFSGGVVGSISVPGIWFNKGTPSVSNYSLYAEATATYINGAGGGIWFRNNNSNQGVITQNTRFILGSTTEDASAIMKLDSTASGFLPPRMTTTQKNAIGTPAAGLIVYDTTLNKLCVRTASAWETITSI